ncbi:uncharacterized protein LOC135828300 [Sycon ciliatum]|uniref:uncharacterized protein LOC135828300 n=1 Tax=Sycon ciliatum TaxID=27933 RepID=UPI0020AB4E40|eukprot:scpid96542/ scgid20318/ 
MAFLRSTRNTLSQLLAVHGAGGSSAVRLAVCHVTSKTDGGKAPRKSKAGAKSASTKTLRGAVDPMDALQQSIAPNTTYSVNYECPEYHGYDEYSYYDIENALLQHRLSQPSCDGWHLQAAKA